MQHRIATTLSRSLESWLVYQLCCFLLTFLTDQLNLRTNEAENDRKIKNSQLQPKKFIAFERKGPRQLTANKLTPIS